MERAQVNRGHPRPAASLGPAASPVPARADSLAYHPLHAPPRHQPRPARCDNVPVITGSMSHRAGHHGSRGATCVTTVAGSPASKDGTHVTHRFPALIAAPATARGRLWLTGARLFDSTVDGTGAPLRPNTAILVEDGVIPRVADDRERCPAGARPVDLRRRRPTPALPHAPPTPPA